MKSYVFDASALFAFLQQTPGAPKVNELLKEAVRGKARIAMSVVNYGEVYGTVIREHGIERARTAMSALHPLPIDLLDATRQRALQAAEIKAKYKLYYL